MPDETNDTYYNFDDYCFYKNKYDSYQESSGNTISIGDSFIPESIKGIKRQDYITECKKIKNYLKIFRTHDVNSRKEFCSYINYWLNSRVRLSYYKIDNFTFGHFQTFMNNDEEIREVNMCKLKLTFMREDIYKEMNKLYNLYDEFESIKSHNNFLYNPLHCKDMSEIVNNYNGIIKQYNQKGSCNLFKALKDLKCLIEYIYDTYKSKCSGSINDVLLLENKLLKDTEPCIAQEKQCINTEQLLYFQEPSVDIQAGKEEAGTPGYRASNAIVPISFIGVGTGMFFILLKKFTPVGKQIRLLTQGNTGTSKNIDNKTYQVNRYNPENRDGDMEGRTYNITYHSIKNS